MLQRGIKNFSKCQEFSGEPFRVIDILKFSPDVSSCKGKRAFSPSETPLPKAAMDSPRYKNKHRRHLGNSHGYYHGPSTNSLISLMSCELPWKWAKSLASTLDACTNNDSLMSFHTFEKRPYGPSPPPLDAGGSLHCLQTVLVLQDALNTFSDSGRLHMALQSVIKVACVFPQPFTLATAPRNHLNLNMRTRNVTTRRTTGDQT